jgi:hypothetical protein
VIVGKQSAIFLMLTEGIGLNAWLAAVHFGMAAEIAQEDV